MASQVNGDVPNHTSHSAFIQHLLDYPVISDGVHTFKSHELGQRSIAITDSAYQTLAANIFPYITKPYQYVSPYVSRVDELGDKTLARLDERFPAVKKPTGELYADTKSLVWFPVSKATEGRDHVYSVYSGEVKKNGDGSGLVGYGKAAVLTALVVSNETLGWLSKFLSRKKEQASEVVNNHKVNQ
jgi:hypothetical protein